MLGSARQVNWKRDAEVRIILIVIPLKNVGRGSVHNCVEGSSYMFYLVIHTIVITY